MQLFVVLNIYSDDQLNVFFPIQIDATNYTPLYTFVR